MARTTEKTVSAAKVSPSNTDVPMDAGTSYSINDLYRAKQVRHPWILTAKPIPAFHDSLSFVIGDIMKAVPSGAFIVNAAQSKQTASKVGGIDGCIRAAAGSDLVTELVRQKNIKVGEMFATKGYDLDVSYILHAVAPTCVQAPSQSRKRLQTLQSLYCDLLKTAADLHVGKSKLILVTPILGTSRFKWPLETGLIAALTGLRTAFEERVMKPGTFEVRIVLPLVADLEDICNAVGYIFPETSAAAPDSLKNYDARIIPQSGVEWESRESEVTAALKSGTSGQASPTVAGILAGLRKDRLGLADAPLADARSNVQPIESNTGKEGEQQAMGPADQVVEVDDAPVTAEVEGEASRGKKGQKGKAMEESAAIDSKGSKKAVIRKGSIASKKGDTIKSTATTPKKAQTAEGPKAAKQNVKDEQSADVVPKTPKRQEKSNDFIISNDPKIRSGSLRPWAPAFFIDKSPEGASIIYRSVGHYYFTQFWLAVASKLEQTPRADKGLVSKMRVISRMEYCIGGVWNAAGCGPNTCMDLHRHTLRTYAFQLMHIYGQGTQVFSPRIFAQGLRLRLGQLPISDGDFETPRDLRERQLQALVQLNESLGRPIYYDHWSGMNEYYQAAIEIVRSEQKFNDPDLIERLEATAEEVEEWVALAQSATKGTPYSASKKRAAEVTPSKPPAKRPKTSKAGPGSKNRLQTAIPGSSTAESRRIADAEELERHRDLEFTKDTATYAKLHELDADQMLMGRGRPENSSVIGSTITDRVISGAEFAEIAACERELGFPDEETLRQLASIVDEPEELDSEAETLPMTATSIKTSEESSVQDETANGLVTPVETPQAIRDETPKALEVAGQNGTIPKDDEGVMLAFAEVIPLPDLGSVFGALIREGAPGEGCEATRDKAGKVASDDETMVDE